MKAVLKYSLLTLLISFIILPIALLDNKALVVTPSKLNPESLSQARTLLKNIHNKFSNPSVSHSFSINISQLEALLSLASQTLKPISARVNHLDDILIVSITMELPIPVSWRHINIQIKMSGDLIESKDSFTQVGLLKLSNKALLNLTKIPLYLLFSETQRDALKNTIQRIKYEQNSIQIQASPFIDTQYLSFIFRSKAKQALKLASSNRDNFMNPKVEFYYDYLNRLVSYITSTNSTNLSLQSISSPLFKEAQKNSTSPSSATLENKAAIIALALFVGDYSLKAFIKNSLSLKYLEIPNKLKFTLHNRKDLVLHFIYSAMIKVFSNDSISNSIGEIKEISDSAKGGSGFSFIDLLADRAGTQFASNAIDSNITAKSLQNMVSSSISENDFFPSIIGLPEGLSAQRFKAEYGNKESTRYQTMINEIDRRINKLAIYN